MPIDFNQLREGLQTIAAAVGVLKQAKDLLPAGVDKTKVEAHIAEAEKQLRLGEAQAAKSLGYHLCKCTFPPQIMLKVGDRLYRCPKCGDEFNSGPQMMGPIVRA